MNTDQVIVHGRLMPDGSLELTEPISLPPGNVRIVIQAIPETEKADEDLRGFLKRIREAQAARGFIPRTSEEVDAELQVLREEAEEEMRELERIQAEGAGFREKSPRPEESNE